MSTKPQRWYEIVDGQAYVYDAPWRDFALSVSIVPVADLAYYRANFNLSRIYGASFGA